MLIVVAAQPESCKALNSVSVSHLECGAFRKTNTSVWSNSGINADVTLMMCDTDSICTPEDKELDCSLSSMTSPRAWGLSNFFD